MFFPLPNYISAGHNRQLHTVSTHWAGSSAADQWPSTDYPRRVRIFGSLATPSTEFIPSWKWKGELVENVYCDFTKLPSDEGTI